MGENTGKKSPISKGIIVVVLVVVIVLAAGVYEFSKPKVDNAMTPAPKSLESMTSEKSVNSYKDGTYTAQGEYLSPGGEEQVGVEATLADGVVTDVIFTPKATRPTSVKFQGQFATGYKEMVVGKNIDEVELDTVSGSSLTPKGFTDALEKVKEQAKA